MNTGILVKTGILAASAIALSTLEGLVPVSAFIPIPGLKLGIANLAVMTAFYLFGKKSAAAVAFIKVLSVFLTFGNVSSAFISSFGTLFAYVSLIITKKHIEKRITFIGVSAFSALSHAVGQLLAACILTGSTASLALLFPLGLCSIATGMLCGFLMNCTYPIVEREFTKYGL